MTRTALTILLILAVCAFSQPKLLKSFPRKISCKVQFPIVAAHDVERPSNENFVTFLDGCTAKIVDNSSMTVAYELDLKVLLNDTGSPYAYVSFYRNLTASDGKWSAVVTDYDTEKQAYSVSIRTGDRTTMLSDSAITSSIVYDSDRLLFAVAESSEVKIYLLRDDLPSSATRDTKASVPVIRDFMGPRTGSTDMYDALGGRIDGTARRAVYGRIR